MEPDEVSTDQLLRYWERYATLAPNERIDGFFLWQMPSWERICEDFEWAPFPITGGPFSCRGFSSSGVYRLVALEEGDGRRPAALNRVCGQDKSGTLYIGEARNLSKRLNELRRSAREHLPEGSHTKMSILRKIRRLKPLASQLEVTVMFTPSCTKRIESDLIAAYINSFGDTPPLNYRFNF